MTGREGDGTADGPATFYLTEVKHPPTAGSGRHHELEVADAYRLTTPRSKVKRTSRTGSSRDSKRKVTAFGDVLHKNARSGIYLDLSTPLSSIASPADGGETGDVVDECRTRYLAACRQLGIAPSSRLLAQITDATHEVNLRGLQLGRKGLNAACAALVEHTKATRIDLGDNAVQGKMVSYIAQLLSHNFFISELILVENKLSGEGIALVAQMLWGDHYLRFLDLSGNHLNDNDSVNVADIMKRNPGINTLKLSHNQFRIQGGKVLGAALAGNDTLDKLDLSWNHLRCQGAEALALGLTKNKGLSLLDISWNGFGFEGCVAIAHALQKNATLQHLNMESNRIHPPALFELTKGLVLNKTLDTLKIGNNPITALSTTPFLTALKGSDCALTVLDMSGVVVDRDFEDTLEAFLEIRFIKVYYGRPLPGQRVNIKWGEMESSMKPRVFNVDPLQILFHLKRNLRNIDLFRLMDKDSNAQLSRDEIAKLLRMRGYPVSSSGMDQIMAYLDTNGDGMVDLGEFMQGERRHKRKKLKSRMRGEHLTDALMDRDDGYTSETGSAGIKFSSTHRTDLATESFDENTTIGKLSRSSTLKLPKI